MHLTETFSPVPVSILVDDGSGQPEEIQANKIPRPNNKGNHDRTEKTRQILRSRNGCKNSGKIFG